MPRYRYIPNDFARNKFNLLNEYTSDGLTSMFMSALGEANYDRYMIAQSLFHAGNKSADVDIILNRGEPNQKRMQFVSIGTAYQLS